MSPENFRNLVLKSVYFPAYLTRRRWRQPFQFLSSYNVQQEPGNKWG